MNLFETLQAICDESLEVAEKSAPAQKKVIAALVDIISEFAELPEGRNVATLEEKAVACAIHLRQGYNIPRNKMAALLEELAMQLQVEKFKAVA